MTAEHSITGPLTSTLMRPQRVLYIVSLFPCWSETFIVREIRALIDDGVDVRILSLKRPSGKLVQTDAAGLLQRVRAPQGMAQGAWKTLKAIASHPIRIAGAAATIAAGTWRHPSAMLKSLAAYARGIEHLEWLRRFDPDLIHAHWATYPSTVAWALGSIINRPFGFTSHAHDIFVNQHLLRRKLEDSALAVTISRHNVDWFNHNVSPSADRKLQVVHCGVDLEHIAWEPDGRSNGLIIGIGRLDPIKGFDTLIDALSLARRNGGSFRCKLIGEGPMRAELEARVHSHGLQDHVEFLGAQPQESVRGWLEKASIFALPCQVAADGDRDGIPVAMMEAMASGCAVVSCRTSGVPELISDGEHGLLVPERDPTALADALQKLLADATLRRRLAGAARQRVEREFDARKEARKLHRLMTRATPMSPKRILVVIDTMEVGGSQRQIVHLLGGLDRLRWQPELLFFRDPSFLVREIQRLGIIVHQIPKHGRVDPRFVLRYAALLRHGHFDVVQAFSLTAELWTAVASMLLREPPRLVSSVHGLYLDESPSFWRLKRFVASRSAAIIACAYACAAVASERAGIAAERFDVVPTCVVIPPTLPSHMLEALRHDIGCPPGRSFGIFVGRLVTEKNLACLIRAMLLLPRDQRPWIALAGDGPLRGEIDTMVDAAGIGADIRFLGERSDATTLMQAADFLVLPSTQEGMSNVLLEAMAADCPVIASAVGGNSELIEHERTGLLFPTNDAAALAECLARLGNEPALRSRLSHKAREHLTLTYGVPVVVAATTAVYDRCMGCKSASPLRQTTRSILQIAGDDSA